MSTRVGRRRKKFIIIALIAIAIAETGYILAAFGLLGGPAAQTPQIVDLIYGMCFTCCLQTVTTKEEIDLCRVNCSNDANILIFASKDYLALRFVDLVNTEFNLTQLIDQTALLIDLNVKPVVDSILTSSEDVVAQITKSLEEVYGKEAHVYYAPYPILTPYKQLYVQLLLTLLTRLQLSFNLREHVPNSVRLHLAGVHGGNGTFTINFTVPKSIDNLYVFFYINITANTTDRDLFLNSTDLTLTVTSRADNKTSTTNITDIAWLAVYPEEGAPPIAIVALTHLGKASERSNITLTIKSKYVQLVNGVETLLIDLSRPLVIVFNRHNNTLTCVLTGYAWSEFKRELMRCVQS